MRKVKPPRKRILLYIAAIFFFLLITSVLISGFALKRGIHLHSFSLGPASIKNLSLQWDNKLKLTINSLLIDTTAPSSKTPKTDIIHKYLTASNLLLKLFSEITVDTIRTHSQVIGFQFQTNQERSFITLGSKDFSYHSTISISKERVTIDNAEFSSKKFDSEGTGKLTFNRSNKNFTGSINATIASSVPITLDFSSDKYGLTFNGKETGKIHTITPLVDLFGIRPSIQRWITGYLTGSRYILKSFSGVIPWDNPAKILNTLKAEVEVVDCTYTFAQGLEPIKSPNTTVEFENGVLNIFPENATFYKQSTGKSWLDINFNDHANIILTAYITTEAIANKDILTLLRYYNISLPFTQTRGKTETDLTLKVNFRSQEVTAEGRFVIPDGAIQYKDAQYHITNAEVLLHNSTVSITDLTLGLGKIFESKVKGEIQFSNKTGSLDISLTHFTQSIGDYTLVLNDKAATPTITYHITPDKHWVDASPSSWLYNGKPFNLGSFNAPFIANDLTIILPITTLSAPPSFIADMSGTFSLVRKFVDAHCNLKHYSTLGVSLQTSTLPVSIFFDKQLELQTEAVSAWEVNGTLAQLSPVDISFEKDVVTWQKTAVQFGENFFSKVSGNYNLEKEVGNLLLSELHIQSKYAGELLKAEENIEVDIKKNSDAYFVNLPQFGTSITVDAEKNWEATIEDFTPLAAYSEILQHYLPHGGKLTVSSTKNDLPYYFKANIPTIPPLIKTADDFLEQLDISGTIHKESAEAHINDAIKINYDKTLRVRANSVDFDLTNIISLLKDQPTINKRPKPQESSHLLPIEVDAFDCSFLFGTGRKIISDEINILYDDGITNAKLSHANGNISLAMKDNLFSLEAKDLSDKFARDLLPNMNFRGGNFNFKAKGSLEEYSAFITINNTLISDFTPLNNILALLDTIPALLTFSLPEYNLKGFPITSLTIGLGVKNRIITVESFTVKSPVTALHGVGVVNKELNSIDMEFNLITQAKTNINKIPLVGYILVGDEKKPSITFKVTGDLDDPDVEHSTFHEIANLPLSILQRTFDLPFKWVNSDK